MKIFKHIAFASVLSFGLSAFDSELNLAAVGDTKDMANANMVTRAGGIDQASISDIAASSTSDFKDKSMNSPSGRFTTGTLKPRKRQKY